jgi:hypothetical protein
MVVCGPSRSYRSLMSFERIIGAFSRRDGLQRIIVVEREDGLFTYKKQFADRDGVLGNPGPACGIYDSPEIAIAEAEQRVWWLKASVPDVC